jgi:hypothetical protein
MVLLATTIMAAALLLRGRRYATARSYLHLNGATAIGFVSTHGLRVLS